MLKVMWVLSLMTLSVFAGTVYRAPQPVETAEFIGMDGGPTVEFNLTVLEAIESSVDGYGSGTVFRVPGGGYGADIGTPDVPCIRRMVQIPNTGDISIEILDSESSILGIYDVLPMQPFGDRSGNPVPLEVNEVVYGTSSAYPSSPVVIERVSILRDIRVAWVRFNPVSVNPVTGETFITTSVTARLVRGSFSGENELHRTSPGMTRSYIPLYMEVLGLQLTDAIIDGSYLVIGPEQAVTLASDLIQWKREKGYEVHVATTEAIGTTSSAIDAYIENAFNTWPNKPEYCLLLGNEDYVPIYWVNSFASDNQYGVIGTGVDPSIHVARLCSDMQNLNYSSWKVFAYETDPYEPASSWFQYAVSIGSTDFNDPMMSWRYKNIMANDGNMDVALYCNNTSYGGTPPTIALLSDKFNDGISLISYIGHGGITEWCTTGFSNSDVAALTNGRRLPWISSIACYNCKFDHSTACFGEAWLNSGSISDPKGAVGFMGASTASPVGPTDSLASWQFKGYFQQNMHHMGAAFDYGKIKAYEYTGHSDNSDMHLIFGEPEHDIFCTTGPLVYLTATHPGQVQAGDFTVNVSTATKAAVEGAMVGLCQGEATLGSGYTDASGAVTINVAGVPASDDVTLTVTAHNLHPLQKTVPGLQTGIEDQNGGVISGLTLTINTPITGSAAISFTVPVSGNANLSLFDMSGRLVETLVDGDIAAGEYSMNWDADKAVGIYFLRLTALEQSIVKSCVILP
ncbi:MAG: T9SS type A sorting domain-containing protein [Candidatus Aegiribacteria sp.]|nr:T9SS type A sorting domain-containing protein [Candidatus Aegiribacteria sp.]